MKVQGLLLDELLATLDVELALDRRADADTIQVIDGIAVHHVLQVVLHAHDARQLVVHDGDGCSPCPAMRSAGTQPCPRSPLRDRPGCRTCAGSRSR